MALPQRLLAAPVVEQLSQELKAQCQALKDRGIHPRLDVIVVGDNPASHIYVKKKQKMCRQLGAVCEVHLLKGDTSPKEFGEVVREIQTNPLIHGGLIQLPLPRAIGQRVESLIPPHKDVDGFHPQNFYALAAGLATDRSLIPCTPKGVVKLLDFYSHPLAGRHVVIIGRSMIVGRPMAMLCLHRGATVTVCHSGTRHLAAHTSGADIIISAVGREGFLDETLLGEGQVVVDVGISRSAQGAVVGDGCPRALEKRARAYTPVPGGIGPMTVISLVENLLLAANG